MTRPRRLIDDCFLHDKDRLRHADVLALLRERVSRVCDPETIALSDATGRVLASHVTAPRDIPAFTNAAVDGYAFAHASLGSGETRLELAGRIMAGSTAERPVASGQAVRIFTGAEMPAGTDTCIMQEDARLDANNLVVPSGVKPGINVRAAGEDVSAGSPVVAAGTRLQPQHLAAIASTGTGSIPAYRTLRVAVVSTGDEIIRPGTGFSDGQVYDSNHFLLAGLLRGCNAEMTDLGILPDDRNVVRRTIKAAAADHDVILTTGGASRGEADFMVETIQELGSLHAWQLAIKPGRPMAFGQIADTVFMGLPGNPVAAFVCFLLYVRPVLGQLEGAEWFEPQRFAVPAGFSIARKKPDRREFLRGWIEGDGASARLQKFARDGSGLISGLTRASGLIEIPEHVTAVAEGDQLSFLPFSEFAL